MVLTGEGMLVTAMDIEPRHEVEFNHWYDKEHLAERVAIPGFLEAGRYVAERADRKYLALYGTETFEALHSPAYENALANQTAWSRANIARFEGMLRVVARVTATGGAGRGGALGFVRLRPPGGKPESARGCLTERLDPASLDAIVAMQLIESDPGLSRSLTEPDAPNPGAGDWYVLVHGTDLEAVAKVCDACFGSGQDLGGCTLVSIGLYRLLWSLKRSDLRDRLG